MGDFRAFILETISTPQHAFHQGERVVILGRDYNGQTGMVMGYRTSPEGEELIRVMIDDIAEENPAVIASLTPYERMERAKYKRHADLFYPQELERQ